MLDRLIDQYTDAVHWLVSQILGSSATPQDVEETVADAFARAWAQISAFDPARTSMKSWLLMVTKYTALNRRRQMMRQRYNARGELRILPVDAAPAPEPNPEEAALRQDRIRQVHQALARLSEADRDLLVRRYFLEEPVSNLAQELGLSRTAIDNRLSRARQALKAALGSDEEVQHIGG